LGDQLVTGLPPDDSFDEHRRLILDREVTLKNKDFFAAHPFLQSETAEDALFLKELGPGCKAMFSKKRKAKISRPKLQVE
jgi:hypothetical protein